MKESLSSLSFFFVCFVAAILILSFCFVFVFCFYFLSSGTWRREVNYAVCEVNCVSALIVVKHVKLI